MEMAKNAHRTIKKRSVNAIMHKLYGLLAEQEFTGNEIEIDGQVFPAEVVSGYIIISLTDGYRVALHHWVWMKNYGKIPQGYHIHHRDADRLNNDINNLALMTARDHISYHTKGSFPETFALFSFLQEKNLWNEYLTYRNTILNNFSEKENESI